MIQVVVEKMHFSKNKSLWIIKKLPISAAKYISIFTK